MLTSRCPRPRTGAQSRMNPILPQGGVTLDHPKKCEGQFYLFFSASNYSGWDFFIFFGARTCVKPHAVFERSPLVGNWPRSCARQARSASASLDGHACAVAPQVADNAII